MLDTTDAPTDAWSGKQAPWIGLGCAGFGGSCGPSTARRILDASFDAGVRHIDTANSYGFGLSERIIGDWLQTIDRDQVTVATKFGKAVTLRSPFNLWARRTFSGSVKPIKRLLSSKDRKVVSHESNRKTVLHIGAEALRASVQQSLTSLRIDRVDVLHLHSVSPESMTDDARDVLLDLIDAGDVGTIGLATNRCDCEVIIKNGLPAGVVQFPDSACWNHPIRWDSKSPQTVVTHSVLGRDGATRGLLSNWLSGSKSDNGYWSERFGIRADNREGVVELLIRGALARNLAGGVLCGISRESQVTVLKRVIETPLDSDENTKLLMMFERFVSEVFA